MQRVINRVQLLQFLSTPSARRATCSGDGCCRQFLFLSTPSARRATDMILNTKPDGVISIHALREEGDTWTT